jgi:hypothetical protein
VILRLPMRPIGDLAARLGQRLITREDLSFVLHCAVILAVLVVVRPMFTTLVPAAIYESRFVLWSMVKEDLSNLATAAQRQRPVVAPLLFLAIPTGALLFGRARIRWQDWEAGRSLRAFVMTLLIVCAWAGSTFDYNMYLDRGHGWDRLVLVGLTALSWRTPLAVPIALKCALVMMKEAYIPYNLDDFDFRPVPEVLIVFSCFVWLSLRKSFKTKHFLLTAIACWACYYYAAGVAKANYGPPWSWLKEDHLSNLSFGGYVRGWLGFIPEPTFVSINAFVRHFDRALTWFTFVLEMGALVFFFLHPFTTRLWFLLCALFHIGIFLLTGIFFWKWIVACFAFWFFLRRGGAPILRQTFRPLVILAGIAMVFFSRDRIYFFPQTGVAWYDTRMVENYQIYAIGPSGRSWLVDPSDIRPMEMHWVMGKLCDATSEKTITGIYGVTGSYATMTALERLKEPNEAVKLVSRGRGCRDEKQQKLFEDFMIRYFGNLNRRGRKWRWTRVVGRPTHLWVWPRGGDLYAVQERVERIELWREIVVNQGGAVHHLDRRMVVEVAIP